MPFFTDFGKLFFQNFVDFVDFVDFGCNLLIYNNYKSYKVKNTL